MSYSSEAIIKSLVDSKYLVSVHCKNMQVEYLFNKINKHAPASASSAVTSDGVAMTEMEMKNASARTFFEMIGNQKCTKSSPKYSPS
jgi:hypothetical protein